MCFVRAPRQDATLNKDGEFESLESIPSPKDRAEGKIQGELILYEGR